MTDMREPETLASPERIVGRMPRVSTIVGYGAGVDRFDISGLHLPIGWEQSVPRLLQLDQEWFVKNLKNDCIQQWRLTPGTVEFDEQTGLLICASVHKKGNEQRIVLSDNFFDRDQRIYRAEGISDIDAAIVLHSIVVRHVRQVASSAGYQTEEAYAYIRGSRSYKSQDLMLPLFTEQAQGELTDEAYQDRFRSDAKRIAAQFDLRIPAGDYPQFSQSGLLQMVTVSPEASYGVYWGNGSTSFGPHNVAQPEQAAALHAIVGSHVNHLLRLNERNIAKSRFQDSLNF